MAISIVQQAKASAENTTEPKDVVFGSAVTAGNLVVISPGYQNTTALSLAVTDTASNTYTQVGTEIANGTTVRMNMFYAKNVTGGFTTVSTDLTGTPLARFFVEAYEIAGCDTTAPLDNNSSGTGNGTSIAASSFTPNVADTIVIAAMVCQAGGRTWTAGSGYTLLTGQGTTANASEYQILSSATAQTTPSSFSGAAANWAVLAASFKIASGGGSSIKTFNGLAYASTKTDDGLAIASIKTKNGLA